MPQIQGPLPTLLHSSREIPLTVARAWLSAYLTRSESKPHMHPDSMLETQGVEFSTHGPEGGVMIHFLRRVSRGLAGEILEPEPVPESEDRVPDSQQQQQQYGDATQRKRRRHDDFTTDSDWEDPEQYAQAQEGDYVGEIGERNNFVGPVDAEPEVREPAGYEHGQSEFVQANKEKDRKKDRSKAKKEAKKAKRKEEQKEREAKRRKEVEEE